MITFLKQGEQPVVLDSIYSGLEQVAKSVNLMSNKEVMENLAIRRAAAELKNLQLDARERLLGLKTRKEKKVRYMA